MNLNSRLSIAVSALKTIKSIWKKPTPEAIEKLLNTNPVRREAALRFSDKHLTAFRDSVAWTRKEIPPTYPYALLTHLHFSLVNDSRFPFSPLGLIHKEEMIECFTPLTRGNWSMGCTLDSILPVERGYEIKITSELQIDGKKAWRSTTTALKKTNKSRSSKLHESPNGIGGIFWKIPNGSGRKYGALSNNIDPIHMSDWSARLMGHPYAVMHGMWTAARGLSELEEFQYPSSVKFKFISPIYLPAETICQKTNTGFSVCSENGKTVHLLAEIADKKA